MGYNMKGYNYPGKSPAKQKSLTGKDKAVFEASEKHSDIGDKINFLAEDYFNEKISKKQYDTKMKYLRAQEKQAGKYIEHLAKK